MTYNGEFKQHPAHKKLEQIRQEVTGDPYECMYENGRGEITAADLIFRIAALLEQYEEEIDDY